MMLKPTAPADETVKARVASCGSMVEVQVLHGLGKAQDAAFGPLMAIASSRVGIRIPCCEQ